MEHIAVSESIHTQLASNIKGISCKFACKSAYASCVNWTLVLPKKARRFLPILVRRLWLVPETGTKSVLITSVRRHFIWVIKMM